PGGGAGAGHVPPDRRTREPRDRRRPGRRASHRRQLTAAPWGRAPRVRKAVAFRENRPGHSRPPPTQAGCAGTAPQYGQEGRGKAPAETGDLFGKSSTGFRRVRTLVECALTPSRKLS